MLGFGIKPEDCENAHVTLYFSQVQANAIRAQAVKYCGNSLNENAGKAYLMNIRSGEVLCITDLELEQLEETDVSSYTGNAQGQKISNVDDINNNFHIARADHIYDALGTYHSKFASAVMGSHNNRIPTLDEAGDAKTLAVVPVNDLIRLTTSTGHKMQYIRDAKFGGIGLVDYYGADEAKRIMSLFDRLPKEIRPGVYEDVKLDRDLCSNGSFNPFCDL